MLDLMHLLRDKWWVAVMERAYQIHHIFINGQRPIRFPSVQLEALQQ